jgi:hypothetical protein
VVFKITVTVREQLLGLRALSVAAVCPPPAAPVRSAWICCGCGSVATVDRGGALNSRDAVRPVAQSGRNINAYSFFPQEGEILLSPAHRFTVSSEPREEGGFTFIDLVQNVGNTFVS